MKNVNNLYCIFCGTKKNRTDLKKQKEKWDKANPNTIKKAYIPSETYVESPKYTSINQMKEELHKNKRIEAGLNATFIDIKDYSKDPSMDYVDNPKNCSRIKYLGNIRKGRVFFYSVRK